MSGKAGSIGGIVLGAVIVVVGFFTYGATWAALPSVLGGALTIAGGVIGLTYQPKNLTQQGAKSEDLQFASSGEGFPVPVIFGEQKVIPNWMNWRADQFRSVEGSVAVGGKGGGGTTQPNGIIDYYLTFELALCMGPIDEIGQVIAVPGDVLCRGSNYTAGNGATASQSGVTVTASLSVFSGISAGATFVWADGTTDTVTAVVSGTVLRVANSRTMSSQRFQIFGLVEQIVFDSDYEEFTLSGINEGGLVRVYRGNSDQTRIEALDPYFDNGMNYRNVAWALHIDFWIARGQPTPKTYQYIVRRFPRCVRDNATTVTELETRGSVDPSHPSYYQANPAAVVYEVMTNRLWGRGISSDLIDEDSFIAASQYFKGKNIGISMTIDSPEKLSTILDGLRMQLKLILTWKNGKWKMRCLLDPRETASTILTLTSDDIEDLRVVRPLWPSTVNDIRGEFTSRTKLYKGDPVHVQDQANIELTGRINTKNVTLRSFTDYNLAAKHATRLLMESSYPAAMATGYINRFKSNLEVGDCVRIIWREWGADTVTAYFLINQLEPQGKNDDRIKLSAVEDVFLSPIAGEETTVALPPAQAWEKIVELTPGDLAKFERPTSQNGAIAPITCIDMPMFHTIGESRICILGGKPSGGTIGSQVYAADENSNNYVALNPGTSVTFAAPLTLATSITGVSAFDRTASFMEFTAAPADYAALLAINTVPTDNDDLEVLDKLAGNYIVIGEEIIKVGLIEQISGPLFRARNVVRGVWGSKIVPHSIGTVMFFTHTFNAIDVPSNPALASGGVKKFKAYPVTAAGVNQVGDPFYVFHEGDNNQILTWRARQPFDAEILDGNHFGNFTVINVRFRAPNAGAGAGPFIGQYNSTSNRTNGVIQEARIDSVLFNMEWDNNYDDAAYGGIGVSGPNPTVNNYQYAKIDDPDGSGVVEVTFFIRDTYVQRMSFFTKSLAGYKSLDRTFIDITT